MTSEQQTTVEKPPVAKGALIIAIYLVILAGSFIPHSRPKSVALTSILIFLLNQLFSMVWNYPGHAAADFGVLMQGLIPLLQWIDFHVIHSPSDFTRHMYNNIDLQPFAERLKWKLDLMISRRGGGWNWEVKNIPPIQYHTTREYFLFTTLKLIRWYIFQDFCWYIFKASPYYGKHPANLFTGSILNQILFSWIRLYISYSRLQISYSILSFLAIAVGYRKPEDCHPFTGNIWDVWTIRRFWGKFWHQTLRRKNNMLFNILTHYISIHQGTHLSRYLQLYLAFIMSGIIHHIPATNQNIPGNPYYQVAFFLMQPLAITFEDLVIHAGKRIGYRNSQSMKVLGMLWTVAWMTWSFRYIGKYYIDSLHFEYSSLPSLLGSLLKQTELRFQ